jgi:hypothetical protein
MRFVVIPERVLTCVLLQSLVGATSGKTEKWILVEQAK